MKKIDHNKIARPEWKTPKHIADKNERERFAQSTIKQELPSSAHRLAWLKDRDNQLLDLLDLFQSLGVSMGAEDWALRAQLLITKLNAEHQAVRRFLRYYHDNGWADTESLEAQIDLVQKIYSKNFPKSQQTCDWCGWPNAELVGGGSMACVDCAPELKK